MKWPVTLVFKEMLSVAPVWLSDMIQQQHPMLINHRISIPTHGPPPQVPTTSTLPSHLVSEDDGMTIAPHHDSEVSDAAGSDLPRLGMKKKKLLETMGAMVAWVTAFLQVLQV